MNQTDQERLFRRWIADHIRLMQKVVRAFTATREDADDLFQEMTLQLWMSLPAFRSEAKETTWIYRVAFHTAMVWKRSERRRLAKHRKLMKFGPTTTAESSPEAARDEDQVQRLYEAIRKLPKLDASIALMHLDGLSYREMSEVLGITENHLGVKLHRVRAQLAELLSGGEHESR